MVCCLAIARAASANAEPFTLRGPQRTYLFKDFYYEIIIRNLIKEDLIGSR